MKPRPFWLAAPLPHGGHLSVADSSSKPGIVPGQISIGHAVDNDVALFTMQPALDQQASLTNRDLAPLAARLARGSPSASSAIRLARLAAFQGVCVMRQPLVRA